MNRTVVSGEPESEMAGMYRELAKKLYSVSDDISGGMRVDYDLCGDCN